MPNSKPKSAPVDKYKERPFEEAKADEKDIEKYEDRQPDQIPDYHEKHPTLRPSKVHDAEPPVAQPGD